MPELDRAAQIEKTEKTEKQPQTPFQSESWENPDERKQVATPS